MNRALTRASVFLSWALRHAPAEAQINLDEHGWASMRDVRKSMTRYGHDPSLLAEIVATDAKGRYTLLDNKVRANYGHSVAVIPDSAPCRPPPVLYHGTARRNLDSIKQRGLVAKARRFVHLSEDVATAVTVGQRHGAPVVIPIDTLAMPDAKFYAVNRVWLTDAVPAACLKLDGLIF